MDKGQRYFTAAGAIRRLNGTLLPRLHKAAVKPHHAYWFDQLPLARSMKCGSSPAEGIEHVPPAIVITVPRRPSSAISIPWAKNLPYIASSLTHLWPTENRFI